MIRFNHKKNKGMSLIEVVIGLAIISSSFITVLGSYSFFVRVAIRNAEVVKVNFLVEEVAEVVRSFRDTSWDNFYALSTSTDHYILFDNGNWSTTSPNVYLEDRFERKFTVSEVYRDAQGDIAALGTLDEGMRKIEVFVSWPVANATSTVSIETYLANVHE